MAEPALDPFTDLDRLPRPGTPERREWDRTIRQANELYPDWASITIGRARYRRDTYEARPRRHGPGLGRRGPRANPSDPRAAVSSR
jgi:hypothetical protein